MAEDTHKYDDIIHLSRPVSTRHARMSMVDRGAQFAPFAALVGYEAVLAESARLTESEITLDEDGKELLDRKLRYIADHLEEVGEVAFLCYEPDEWKPGGKYVFVRGEVRKIDMYHRTLLLSSGEELGIENIRAIDGENLEDENG